MSTFSHDAVQILASPESIAGGAPNCKTRESIEQQTFSHLVNGRDIATHHYIHASVSPALLLHLLSLKSVSLSLCISIDQLASMLIQAF